MHGWTAREASGCGSRRVALGRDEERSMLVALLAPPWPNPSVSALLRFSATGSLGKLTDSAKSCKVRFLGGLGELGAESTGGRNGGVRHAWESYVYRMAPSEMRRSSQAHLVLNCLKATCQGRAFVPGQSRKWCQRQGKGQTEWQNATMTSFLSTWYPRWCRTWRVERKQQPGC